MPDPKTDAKDPKAKAVLKVRAISMGYMNDRIVHPGEEFFITREMFASWMRPLDAVGVELVADKSERHEKIFGPRREVVLGSVPATPAIGRKLGPRGPSPIGVPAPPAAGGEGGDPALADGANDNAGLVADQNDGNPPPPPAAGGEGSDPEGGKPASKPKAPEAK